MEIEEVEKIIDKICDNPNEVRMDWRYHLATAIHKEMEKECILARMQEHRLTCDGICKKYYSERCKRIVELKQEWEGIL